MYEAKKFETRDWVALNDPEAEDGKFRLPAMVRPPQAI